MSDILIAGSAGFVGSSITNYMIQYSKYEVASADNLAGKDLKGLSPSMAARNRHQFYLLDLCDEVFVNKVLDIERPKCVIYNALAASEPAISSKLVTIIESCLASSSVEKFILIFKNLYDNFTTFNMIEEELARQKVIEEMEEQGKTLCLVKTCELIGPRQSPGSFIPDTILALMNDRTPIIADDQLREWMYVKEFYIRLTSLIEANAKPGTYRIFSGSQASQRSIGAYLDKIIRGQEGTYEFIKSMPDRGVPGEKHYLPVRNMGFGLPENSLEDILQHVACWYRDNRRSWGMHAD